MSWRDSAKVRRRALLLGYNLPWILWTLYALLAPVLDRVGRWPCPIHRLIGWCPGCGLTSAYGRFLRGEGMQDAWPAIVLAGFLLNAIWSVAKARNPAPGPLPPNGTGLRPCNARTRGRPVAGAGGPP